MNDTTIQLHRLGHRIEELVELAGRVQAEYITLAREMTIEGMRVPNEGTTESLFDYWERTRKVSGPDTIRYPSPEIRKALCIDLDSTADIPEQVEPGMKYGVIQLTPSYRDELEAAHRAAVREAANARRQQPIVGAMFSRRIRQPVRIVP